MLRRTDLALTDLAPGRSPASVRDWTATFTLAWADQRHRLQATGPAAGRAEAEVRAWRAMADHLRGLADRAARATKVAEQAGVEPGFRALEGLGWPWRRSRRTDPARVARHRPVLAVAGLTVLARGTRVEDARERGPPPARPRAPPVATARARPRRLALFRLGLQWLRRLLARGRLRRRLRLAPEPWPRPPPGLAITVHGGQA